METRANNILIGAFVLALLAASFGFVYWISGFGGGVGSARYYVVIEGSVTGLKGGSRVFFNGLPVGAVQSMRIDPEDGRKVRILVTVDSDIPIRADSLARIETQGLTGLAVIQITPGTPDSPRLVATREGAYPIIRSNPSLSGSLLTAAPEALANANAFFVRLNQLVATNEQSITNTVKNIESFSNTLDANGDDITAIVKEAKLLSGKLNKLADKVDAAVDRVDKFVTADTGSFLAEAQEAAKSFRRLADKLETNLGGSSGEIAQFAKSGLREFELFMRDGRKAAKSLDRLIQRVERNPQSLIFGN